MRRLSWMHACDGWRGHKRLDHAAVPAAHIGSISRRRSDSAFAGMTSGWACRWAGFALPAARWVSSTETREGTDLPARRTGAAPEDQAPARPARRNWYGSGGQLPASHFVANLPAQAGTQCRRVELGCTLSTVARPRNGSTTRPCPQRTLVHIQAPIWIPAFAGMTKRSGADGGRALGGRRELRGACLRGASVNEKQGQPEPSLRITVWLPHRCTGRPASGFGLVGQSRGSSGCPSRASGSRSRRARRAWRSGG